MKQLTILGSTGSIGCSTLDVVRHNPEHFRVVALVAGKNVTRMVEQCLEFSPRYAVMDDEASAKLLKTMLQQQGSRTEVLSGQQAACDMAALEELKKSNPYLGQCRIICVRNAHYLEHIHEAEYTMAVKERSAAGVIAYLRREL